jgi:hypothetical protein
MTRKGFLGLDTRKEVGSRDEKVGCDGRLKLVFFSLLFAVSPNLEGDQGRGGSMDVVRSCSSLFLLTWGELRHLWILCTVFRYFGYLDRSGTLAAEEKGNLVHSIQLEDFPLK